MQHAPLSAFFTHDEPMTALTYLPFRYAQTRFQSCRKVSQREIDWSKSTDKVVLENKVIKNVDVSKISDKRLQSSIKFRQSVYRSIWIMQNKWWLASNGPVPVLKSSISSIV